MTIERHLKPHVNSPWDELDGALPTIRAFAERCAHALIADPAAESLREEAETLLFLARERGVFELKAASTAFQSADRLLAVYVETNEGEYLALRSEDPRFTMRFLEAFRQLCGQGLVMHQVHSEFSLTHAGFERSEQVQETEVRDRLDEVEAL